MSPCPGKCLADGAMPEEVKARLTAQANSPTRVGSVGDVSEVRRRVGDPLLSPKERGPMTGFLGSMLTSATGL